ncbi:anillin isoform X2 [Drosophila subpulchrella]|uniref:anillin isoform X2 n=1 Tax=Drosophila subpulchrella TaxID=1486046 RepID=UPI0018A19E52|nr:anillin isoform X2 [Drosophila subpulchrella]
MDPFTQHMLEKAEQRSRALGISNASKFPLAECSVPSSTTTTSSSSGGDAGVLAPRSRSPGVQSTASGGGKVVVLGKATLEASPAKPLRHYTAVNKENLDMGIEINITTDKPIGVQVEIQEQEVTDSEEEEEAGARNPLLEAEPVNQPLARLRDTSRSRLQRMGALYSNTDDLSSPIHRTEAQFHVTTGEEEENGNRSSRQPKQRLGKLAALADTINQWEDDTSHHEVHRPLDAPPPKPHLSSRRPEKPPAPQPPKRDEVDEAARTKQLKWDPKGEAAPVSKQEETTPVAKPPVPEKSTTVSQVAKNFAASAQAPKPSAPAPAVSVKTGLVSGRAAIFENKGAGGQTQGNVRNQKDPCELSLKERMKLFESGNNKAMLPMAPIGSAPSISQIRAEEVKQHLMAVHPVTAAAATTVVAATKPKPENKLRDKVAALVANAQSSAETRIKDIDRQRQEDMQIISNRFNKQKELFDIQPAVTSAPAPTRPPAPDPPRAPAPAPSKVVRPMPPPPPPPIAGLSPALASSKRRSPGDAPITDEDSKRARKSHSDRLYPALSDLDSSGDNCCATETASATDDSHQLDEEESDSCMDESEDQSQTEDSSAGMCDGSLGREIMSAVQRNETETQQQPRKKTVRYADMYYDDSSLNSSQVSSGMNDYLDEALAEDSGSTQDDQSDSEDEHNASRLSLGSKGTTASNSFSFRKNPATACTPIDEHHEMMDMQTPMLSGAQPVKSELSVNQDNDNLVTLVHTVSFYRRQQSANSSNSTPVRKICREQQVMRSALAGDCHAKHRLEYDSPQQGQIAAATDDQTDEDDDEMQNAREINEASQAQDKIKKLLSEVCKQQQVIGQASQALNLCAATVEFSGSTESVEGERYLLLATHRRQACLDEVQRLRVENSIRPVGAPKEKGLLTVKDITIPLRQEYVRKMASNNINGHHLVCLLKYNEHVLATKTVPTMPGLLSVKFPDVLQLNNVYADFRITLEIYGMLAQRDQLPHELKYHINLNKKGGVKTPKKKGGENRLVMPPVQSPAGPHVVRTPQLVQYGFAIFSLREIQRTTWTLTQVLGVSPLEGMVHMKVNCELSVSVEYKGFLTMFEDISGFGAWHRRWCYLNGTVINFWKYPDDEKRKTPMGSIDLNACSSQKVTTAPRDICARLNTMLLECERPALETDQESLIIVPNGPTTTVRHLLSADTKEEREEWCAYLNKALTLLRAWGTTH